MLFILSVIFGEDVAFGGVFRCTVGLRDKHGEYLGQKHIVFKILGDCELEPSLL